MKNTSDFEECVKQQVAAIRSFKPDVVIGKSQGGPTIMRLIHDKVWNGPSIICCGALVPGIDNFKLPPHVPFLIVNGSKDIAVSVSIGQMLKEVNAV